MPPCASAPYHARRAHCAPATWQVDRHLSEYRASMEEINNKGAGGGDAADAAGATRALASTISALPELQEKKRLLDAHMNIATELLRQIQSRSLDSYYALEENLMDGRPLGKDDRATLAFLLAIRLTRSCGSHG